MSKARLLKKLCSRFMGETCGNVATFFALSLVPLGLVTGGAVDFSFASSARADLQHAIDSAALNAALDPDASDRDREAAAREYILNNLRNSVLNPNDVTLSFDFDTDMVHISASSTLQTRFLRLGGISEFDIAANTSANAPQPQPAELVLVLDYSGSMEERSGGQVKYRVMRDAAINLINDLRIEEDPDLVKFGLVAYSSVIQVMLPSAWVRGQGDEGMWTGCVQDREYPYNVNGTTPDPDREETKWIPLERDCSRFDLQSVALTSDHDALIDQLEEMRPIRNGGFLRNTHISLGMEAGFNLLSAGSEFDGRSVSQDTKKYLVLLTDGRQTTRANGPNGRSNVRQGEVNLERLCETAQSAEGVTVITVAFDLRNRDTEERLADCASDRDRGAFVAEDGDALQGVFNEIRNQLRRSIFISS